jgi:hypothetical protein
MLAPAADGAACVVLDDYLVAVGYGFANRGRGQADTVFVVLDFLGNADTHTVSFGGDDGAYALSLADAIAQA